MATTKFKMPTDKQIWAEVDAFLDAYPEAVKQIRKPPTREELFKKKKTAYKETPARLAAEAKAKKEKAAAVKAADKAYLELRKKQAKPIFTLQQLVKKYPDFSFAKDLTQQKLHETAEVLAQIDAINVISSEVTRFEAASRRLTAKYLTQTYGAYRTITKSEVADETFASIRSALWHKFNIKTHEDIPRASLLLKMVFKNALEKTIHLYARSFMIADSYDVEQADFDAFIKDLGGMEKIRKAYATVLAADAGKLVPLYVKQSEEYASITALHDHDPFVVQMLSGQTVSYHNDIFDSFCLVLAHKAPMDQLELVCHIPSTTAIENYVLGFIANAGKDRKLAKSDKWIADRNHAISLNLKKAIDDYLEKDKKNTEKEAVKKKKAEALAKKNAADAKRFEKQRTSTKAASKAK